METLRKEELSKQSFKCILFVVKQKKKEMICGKTKAQCIRKKMKEQQQQQQQTTERNK